MKFITKFIGVTKGTQFIFAGNVVISACDYWELMIKWSKSTYNFLRYGDNMHRYCSNSNLFL